MSQPQNRRVVLTSVNQVIGLVQSNPQLLEKMSKFNQLKDVQPSVTPKKSCNCGAKQNITTPDVNKQVAEAILSSLTEQDFLQIKEILQLTQLCHYKRDTSTGKLQLTCV
jgi:hypothetical protein